MLEFGFMKLNQTKISTNDKNIPLQYKEDKIKKGSSPKVKRNSFEKNRVKSVENFVKYQWPWVI